MNVRLDKFGNRAVKKLMQSGHWSSASKVISDGLRVVCERHRLWNVQRQEFRDRLLRPALREFRQGKVVIYDRSLLVQIKLKKPSRIKLVPTTTTPNRNRVQLSRSAICDLHYYWKNACDPEPRAGDRFLGKVDRLLESLVKRPKQGNKREELWRGLRSLGAYTLAYPWFVIFYIETKGKLCVFRVLHWTHDPPSRMRFP